MNQAEYTDRHAHPDYTDTVQIVAYERRDETGWDVFVFEPVGTVPELENRRTDEWHIFVERIAYRSDLDEATEHINRRLGTGYEAAPYMRETGTRQVIGRVYDHLRYNGARGMSVRSVGQEEWELWVRRKDWHIAEEVTPSTLSKPIA